MRRVAPTLPKGFVDENFAFFGKTLSGTPEIPPRWKRCVTAADNSMGMALGKVYVQEYFPPAAKKRADELVRNLLDALNDDIKTLDWMSERTKKAAAAKVATFHPKIGYPDQWRDYSTLTISRDYAADSLAANQFEWRRDLGKIGKPVDRYGAIGGVIGHEITHGFDDEGRKYDANGNQVDWWTEQDGKNFDARAECIIKQFDGYFVEKDLHENGKLVQGESIADLGGLTIAYRAFRKTLEGKPEPAPIDGLNADQRFFVANARIWATNHRPEFARLIVQTNEHPLGEFRSVGTVSNMPEFAKTFGCGAGTAMVRQPRCQIW